MIDIEPMWGKVTRLLIYDRHGALYGAPFVCE